MPGSGRPRTQTSHSKDQGTPTGAGRPPNPLRSGMVDPSWGSIQNRTTRQSRTSSDSPAERGGGDSLIGARVCRTIEWAWREGSRAESRIARRSVLGPRPRGWFTRSLRSGFAFGDVLDLPRCPQGLADPPSRPSWLPASAPAKRRMRPPRLIAPICRQLDRMKSRLRSPADRPISAANATRGPEGCCDASVKDASEFPSHRRRVSTFVTFSPISSPRTLPIL